METGDVSQAIPHLQAGRVIAYPTEAVWGIGCDPDNESAVHDILRIKQRPVDKGLLLVAADTEQLAALLAGLPEEKIRMLNESWPGPVTWLIPDPGNLFPDWVKGKHSSIAIRVSAHPLVHALCKAFGKPIVSTSANLAGEPEIKSRSILVNEFASSIHFIVDGELGDASAPSTIKDLMTGQVIR